MSASDHPSPHPPDRTTRPERALGDGRTAPIDGAERHHDDARLRRRRRVAELVVARARGDVGGAEFRDAVLPLIDGDDLEAAELVALVERAPTRSWFFGVDRHAVEDDSDRIAYLVAQFLGARPGDPAPDVQTRRTQRD